MSASSPHASVMGDPARLASCAADAERAAEQRLFVAVEDIFLSQPGRLDDRTRAATLRLAEATIGATEQQISGDAARTLMAAGRREAAAVLGSNRSLAWPRLLDAGLMRDTDLIGALIAQARVDLLDESLAALRAPDAGPTLVTMLIERGDAAQRAAASDYLLADGKRRMGVEGRQAILPAAAQARIAWWVAAALREQLGAEGGAVADAALCEAAQRRIARANEGQMRDAAARLVHALSPTVAERGALMVRALESARTPLFAALLAEAIGVDAEAALSLVLDSTSDRLWLALRAAALDRDAIARAGFLLSEADRERDVTMLIEVLDPLAALDPTAAAAAIATLRLPGDFRAAVRALAARAPAGRAGM
ncbi:DUF2336 domain-containing protein [Sphingomonas phyllosphaerae]|uniref:DUF2336 domain-containing protein n=1 Tax=Sphingomonas phyllosphaerae TaxID=257003 RepID=UPI00040410E2|nr:DUF2336 domain-containing protein [Sphingomonas phyllosphaerae]